MVKHFLSFFLIFSLVYADNIDAQTNIESPKLTNSDGLIEVEEVNPVLQRLELKIRSLLDESTYKNNEAYINIIFSPRSEYIFNNRVDCVKVVQTLKDNGLLNLYFDKPSELRLNFHTSDNPLFL